MIARQLAGDLFVGDSSAFGKVEALLQANAGCGAAQTGVRIISDQTFMGRVIAIAVALAACADAATETSVGHAWCRSKVSGCRILLLNTRVEGRLILRASSQH